MNSSTRKLLLVAALAIVSSVGLLEHWASAAKPAPPPPPLPPVRFQLTVFSMPSSDPRVSDMNNVGELVGEYFDAARRQHAFIIDPAAGGQVVDLGTQVTPPDGWYVAIAYGINDQGSIVGALGQVGTPLFDRNRGFVIHRPAVGPAVLELPPDSGSSYTHCHHINEDGTVLGHFVDAGGEGAYYYNPLLYGPAVQVLPLTFDPHSLRLNNSVGPRPAQVAGHLVSGPAFVYTLGDPQPEIFPQIDASVVDSSGRPYEGLLGINDAGTFCGFVAYTTTKPPRTRPIAFRYGATYQEFPATANYASSINLAGDMAIPANLTGTSSPTQLYSEGYGVMNLDSLMVGNAADLALWQNRFGRPLTFVVTERGSLNPAMPGYPALGGYFTSAEDTQLVNYAFILTPVAP